MAKHLRPAVQPAALVAMRAMAPLGLVCAWVLCLATASWSQETLTSPRPASRTTVTAELLADDQLDEPEPPPAARPPSPMRSLQTSEEPGWVGPPQQEIYNELPHDTQPSPPRGIFRPLFYNLSSDGRSRGIGNPLGNESWLNRPFHLDFLGGGIFIPSLLRNRVDAGGGFLFGLRFGWDYSHFWGFETRAGDAHLGLSDPINNSRLGSARIFVWDVNWLYYPLGDTQWRPFFSLGTGLANIDFTDNLGSRTHDNVLSLPIGMGLKYRVDNRLAFRVDVQDLLTFGSGNRIDTLNNLVITSSVEVHFGGGPRKSYWPWAPSRAWW